LAYIWDNLEYKFLQKFFFETQQGKTTKTLIFPVFLQKAPWCVRCNKIFGFRLANNLFWFFTLTFLFESEFRVKTGELSGDGNS